MLAKVESETCDRAHQSWAVQENDNGEALFLMGEQARGRKVAGGRDLPWWGGRGRERGRKKCTSLHRYMGQ